MRISNLMSAFLVAALVVTGTISAQEETESESVQTEMTVIAGDSLDGGSPMIFATESTSIDGGVPSIRMMTGGNSRIALAGPGGFPGMGAPDPYSLLSDASVQKDLELVGDQLDQVRELQSEFSNAMREQIGDLSKGGINPDRFKGLGEMMKTMRAAQREKMEALLLPHQIDRLKQVALQKHMQQAGTAGALTSSKVAEALNITDEQKERLVAKQKEIKEELAKQMEQLKEDAKNKLLLELTSEQRQMFKDMTGETFKSEPKDWQNEMQRRFQSRRKAKGQ